MLRTDFLVKLAGAAVLSGTAYLVGSKLYARFKQRRILIGSLTSSLFKAFGDCAGDVKHGDSISFHKVLFFPDFGIICKRMLAGRECKLTSCPYVHESTSLSCLVETVNLAKHSLDVCVYRMTSTILSEMVIDAQRHGLTVRVISDDKNSGEVAGTQIRRLRVAGIPVRCIPSSILMHHQFVILDNEVLINGFLNWTNSAVLRNFENVLITTEDKLLHPFTEEFSKLWKLLEPSTSM